MAYFNIDITDIDSLETATTFSGSDYMVIKQGDTPKKISATNIIQGQDEFCVGRFQEQGTVKGEVFNDKTSSSTFNLAEGDYSHAEGYYVTAASSCQHVQGKYNIEDSNSNYADIIGGGTSNANRKNISTTDWNGNMTIAGNMVVQDTYTLQPITIIEPNQTISGNSYTGIYLILEEET